MVVCVDSNDGISAAFATANGFDVVITDMYRDAVDDRPAEPEAGLKTVSIIKAEHPNVPIIIYAGHYSQTHEGKIPKRTKVNPFRRRSSPTPIAHRRYSTWCSTSPPGN
jgi:hypothetical protein